MRTVKKQSITRGFIQALLLALLLNLSGHTFLHLTDAAVDTGEPQLTAHEEPRGLAAPQHQCSVCQDHQQLTLDVPATATVLLAVPLQLAKQRADFVFVAPSRHHISDRAPPRS